MLVNETTQLFMFSVSTIVNQIRSYGDTIEGKRIIQKVFGRLLENFDGIILAIEEPKYISEFSFYELISSLRHMMRG